MSSKFQNLSSSNILQPKHLNSANLNNSNDQRPNSGVKGLFHDGGPPTTAIVQSHGNFLRDLNFTNGFNISNGAGAIDVEELIALNDGNGVDCNSNGSIRITQRKAPNTMAKRNARERNRVKLVNQGFQTLRHHIPEDYRVKKMSKVDVLRCALYYIRSLEQKLQLPMPSDSASSLGTNEDEDGADNAYSFCEGIFSTRHHQHMSCSELPHISSLSQSTSSDLGEEGDSSFCFSDEDDQSSRDAVKRPRMSHSPPSAPTAATINVATQKQETLDTDSYAYHHHHVQYKTEPMNINKIAAAVADASKSPQILIMANGVKIEKDCLEAAAPHHSGLHASNMNHGLQSQHGENNDDENNDENYHCQSQDEWGIKVTVP